MIPKEMSLVPAQQDPIEWSKLVSEELLYRFTINNELFVGVDSVLCKDKIREKSEKIGELVYICHNVLKNRARRRRKKSHHFSAVA